MSNYYACLILHNSI